jgi:hypothetical protein
MIRNWKLGMGMTNGDEEWGRGREEEGEDKRGKSEK